MHSHIKVVGIVHIVLSGLSLLAAFTLLVGATAVAALIGLEDAQGGVLAFLIFTVVPTFFLVTAIPGLVCGLGLLNYRPWARILAIILAALQLLNFPIGTLFGAYSFWVLLSADGAAAFRTGPSQ